jgi:hypothetical protein
MPANAGQFVVGRLLEIRIAHGFRTLGDVRDMSALIGERVATLGRDEKFSIVADWRAVHVMSPEVAALAREMLSGVNPHLARSAILTLPADPTSNLQVVRLIREAENKSRRQFSSAVELERWLSPVLTPAEAKRLKIFLELPG